MMQSITSTTNIHSFDIERFLKAQEGVYEQVCDELRQGRKRSHWIWFIFPQLEGLGFSSTARFYGIKHLDEARAYLAHPVLGPRLHECAQLMLAHAGQSPTKILGSPDDLKLKSSMTLFELLTGPESVFAQVLEQFYAGERDSNTLELLQG